ncbi:hypothetical protein B5S29_g5378 [[Candida] boidinii]|nr:hypothetical protein B5S29_g5378 [[Candida] boidinii]
MNDNDDPKKIITPDVDLRNRSLFKDDLMFFPKLIYSGLSYKYDLARGRVSTWYWFENSVFRVPNKLALIYPKELPNKSFKDGDNMFKIEKFTYKELYNAILRMSFLLVNEYQVKPGDVVALDFTNKPLFIILWWACWNLSITPAFINYNIKGESLAHCIKIVKADHVFVDDPEVTQTFNSCLDILSKDLPDLKINYLNEDNIMNQISSINMTGDDIDDDEAITTPKFRLPDNLRLPKANNYDPAVFIYTSGTTGLPKSAIITWKKTFIATKVFSYFFRISENSNIYTSMPVYHATAAILAVVPAFCHGGTLSLGHRFSARTFWTQVKLCGANTMQYVGEACRYLVKAPYHSDENYHSVKVAYGNGLRRDIWYEFKKRFNIEAIGEFYASTESPVGTTNFEVGLNSNRIGACGAHSSFINNYFDKVMAVAKIDPDDPNEIYRDPKTGFAKKADSDENGELIMKILNPKKRIESFQGYYNNESETSAKLIVDVFEKGDMWFRTNDLMKYDSNKFMYFVDRMGDTFRWKSENVSTTEVENIISKVKEIKQSVIVGVKVPNHEGRAGFAIIEANNLPASSHNVTSDEIDESTKALILKNLSKVVYDELPNYARPMFLRFGKIQTTGNHKIQKKTYRNPILPKGKNEDQNIYWLNPDSSNYELLNNEIFNKISDGSIRL